MKLSNQAMGSIMMVLQKSLLEQSDIVPMLENLDFLVDNENQDEIFVSNPPIVKDAVETIMSQQEEMEQ